MKGVQFLVASPGCCNKNQIPKPITAISTETLVTTIKLLKAADSLIPTTKSKVIAITIQVAGRFIKAPVATKCPLTYSQGAVASE